MADEVLMSVPGLENTGLWLLIYWLLYFFPCKQADITLVICG